MPIPKIKLTKKCPAVDLDWRLAGSTLPPLGEGLTPSVVVLLICDNALYYGDTVASLSLQTWYSEYSPIETPNSAFQPAQH